MGYVAANRRERKRVSRHARMRAQPTGFYRKQRLSTLVGLAKKEGLVSGDLPICAFPDHPKELIGVMRRHFRQVHYKKNTLKASNTPAGIRLRGMIKMWKASAGQPLLRSNDLAALSAIESCAPEDGCCQSVLRTAMCGLVASIPVALAAGVFAVSQF